MAVKKVLAALFSPAEGNRLRATNGGPRQTGIPFAGALPADRFALSNLTNSGYWQIVVLTQYKSHSLDRHVSETWRMSTQLGNYIASVPAQQRVSKSWFLGAPTRSTSR